MSFIQHLNLAEIETNNLIERVYNYYIDKVRIQNNAYCSLLCRQTLTSIITLFEYKIND
jgi:hypothetical protein